jgi:uncharacterized membrane protein YjjB (DUF3815 family)
MVDWHMKMAQELTGIFFGVLGFSFVFRLQKKLILDICVGSEIVWIIYRLLLYETGYMFISCVAASVFIEIYAEFMSKKRKSMPGIYITLLVFPLIPGGGLYYTMSAIVQENMHEAIAQGVLTLKYALGIAVGISLSGTYRKIYKKWICK